jgi:hypothetical protein
MGRIKTDPIGFSDPIYPPDPPDLRLKKAFGASGALPRNEPKP